MAAEKKKSPPAEEKKNDALAAAPKSTLATNAPPLNLGADVPDWLKQEMTGQAPMGLETMDPSDLIYPRLVLCQGLTPAVQDGKRQSGDIMNNLTAELIAKQGDKVKFIPIVMSYSMLYLKSQQEGGGVLCRSDDAVESRKGGCGVDQGGTPTLVCADCVHKEWDDSATDPKLRKPKCQEYINVMGLLPEFGYMPFVWSGKATQLKVMKRFLSIAKVSGVHLFAMQFNLFSVSDEGGGFKYKNWDFEPAGYVSQQEYMHAAKLFNEMKGKSWSADVKDLETHGDTDAPLEGTPAPF